MKKTAALLVALFITGCATTEPNKTIVVAKSEEKVETEKKKCVSDKRSTGTRLMKKKCS